MRALDVEVPANVREVSEGLQYRDFITVGVLANRLDVTESDKTRIQGHVDLYPGAGRVAGAAADLQ